MSKNRFKFTVKSISNIAISDTNCSTRACYYDTTIRGFGIYVTANGVKTFFVYRRIEGRPTRIILGRTDEITLDRAREKAQDVHSQIAEGVNPQDKKRAIRQEITLGELWEMYLERHAKIHRTSWSNDVSLYKLYLTAWAGRKLSFITAQTIRELHAKIGREKGIVTAIPITKNGKPHIVPLVEQAVEIIKNRRLKTNSEWVFPSAKSKSGHLENPLCVWDKVLKRSGITNLRI